MRSHAQWKVQQLLRLAELCTSEDEERKKFYMDEIDELLFNTEEKTIEEEERNDNINYLWRRITSHNFEAEKVAGARYVLQLVSKRMHAKEFHKHITALEALGFLRVSYQGKKKILIPDWSRKDETVKYEEFEMVGS